MANERISLKTNNDSFIKVIAFISMIIDHAGGAFTPGVILFKILGRLAFPIFAYKISEGYIYTKNLKRYFVKLLLCALTAQVPFTYLFGYKLNTIFTLILGLVAIYLYDKVYKPAVVLPIILAELVKADYGAFGVIVIVTYFVLKDRPVIKIIILSLAVILFSIRLGSYEQIFAISAFILIELKMFYPDTSRLRINKYFFYIAYPLHLTILAVILIFL